MTADDVRFCKNILSNIYFVRHRMPHLGYLKLDPTLAFTRFMEAAKQIKTTEDKNHLKIMTQCARVDITPPRIALVCLKPENSTLTFIGRPLRDPSELPDPCISQCKRSCPSGSCGQQDKNKNFKS